MMTVMVAVVVVVVMLVVVLAVVALGLDMLTWGCSARLWL